LHLTVPHTLHTFRGRISSHQAPVTGRWVVDLYKATVYSYCYLNGSITETLCVCFRSSSANCPSTAVCQDSCVLVNSG